MFKIFQFINAAFLLLFSAASFAQQQDMTNGGIRLSFSTVPDRPYKDTTGSAGYRSLGVNINLPLLGNRNKVKANVSSGGSPYFYQVGLRGGFEALHYNIGFLPDQRTFYNASAGLGAVIYSGKKNLIITEASTGFAADEWVLTTNGLRYRVSGSFIINHLQNRTLMYQYGVVFTYAYGKPLPLPVLGIRKKFADHWTFSAIVPVSVQLRDKISKDVDLSFFIKPSGNRFQFQNQQHFATPSAAVFMSLRQFELGSSFLYKFSRQFSLRADASLLGKGKIKFTEMDGSHSLIYQAETKPGTRFGISLHYLFPHKKKPVDVGNDMEEWLSP